MAWQNPKTNWQAADVVSKNDFNRIEGNVQELQNTKETPAGAQGKANTAETNAKNHANGLVGTLGNLLTVAKNNAVAAINELVNDIMSHKAEDASTTAKGHVQLSSSTSSTSTSLAATASAVKTVNDALTSHKAENASTSEKGHVQLTDSVSSTSTTTAATPNSVKQAYDKANAALPKTGGTMTGILTAQSNTSYTVRQVRNIILSTADADVGAMQNGDIWIKYK